MPTVQKNPVLAVETAQDFQQRIDTVVNSLEQSPHGILFSSDLEIEPLEEPSGLSRTPITFPINDLNMFYVLEAPPDTKVVRHAHQSDVFRYILEGELIINDIPVQVGTWLVVPKGTPYAVTSKTGYKALVAYKDICEVTGLGPC